MSYCRLPSSHFPQRQQYDLSKSVAKRVAGVGAIGIAPVSIPNASRAPFTRFRHRLMPLCSRSAVTNAINRAVSPSASCASIVKPLRNEGDATKRNTVNATRPEFHDTPLSKVMNGGSSAVVNQTLPKSIQEAA